MRTEEIKHPLEQATIDPFLLRAQQSGTIVDWAYATFPMDDLDFVDVSQISNLIGSPPLRMYFT